MTTVEFAELNEPYDKIFVDRMRDDITTLLSRLSCKNHSPAGIKLSISGHLNHFHAKIIEICCTDFLELARKHLPPFVQ